MFSCLPFAIMHNVFVWASLMKWEHFIFCYKYTSVCLDCGAKMQCLHGEKGVNSVKYKLAKMRHPTQNVSCPLT